MKTAAIKVFGQTQISTHSVKTNNLNPITNLNNSINASAQLDKINIL
jgi:hypothetical protein